MGIEAHLDVATQLDSMLPDQRRNYASPHCEGTRPFIVAENVEAQADAGRGPQRGKFPKTTPGTRAAGPLARRRSGVHQTYTIQHVTSDEGLWWNQYRGALRICKAQWLPLRHVFRFWQCTGRGLASHYPRRSRGRVLTGEDQDRRQDYLRHFMVLVGRRVRQIGRTLRRETLASAGRG